MIEIKNLYKRYHNHHANAWVLRDVNITIPSGVSVGLIGGNGAGKSTLLRLIAGMDTPDKGEVIRYSRVSWPIGLSGGMQGSLTGRQNVKFVARAQGRSKDVENIISFVEDFAEIGSAFDDPVKTYSSGMKSRLSFGLSLAFNFDIYISDEATSVGDKAFRKKAHNLFNSKVAESSIIMVSHSENTLKEFCKAGIYLKDGQAIWYDNINKAIDEYNRDQLGCPSNNRRSVSGFSNNSKIKKNDNELKRTIEGKNKILSGVLQVIRKANEEDLDYRQINILKKIHKDLKTEIDELKDIYEKTEEGMEKANRKLQNDNDKLAKGISWLLGNKIANELSSNTVSFLQKIQHSNSKSDNPE